MGGPCSDHLLKDLDQMHQLMPVADPGEGPGGPNPPENETDRPLKCEMDVVKVFLLFPYINDRTLSFL